MKTFKQYLNEEISKKVLDDLEVYFDKIYKSLGIDIEFTKHFHQQVNDPRNIKGISRSELVRIFRLTKKEHGPKIKRMNDKARAVISDMETDNNMPFEIKAVKNKKGIDLQLVAITVMRKPTASDHPKKFSTEYRPDKKNLPHIFKKSPRLRIGDEKKKDQRKKGWSKSHQDNPDWIREYGTAKQKAELKAKEKAPIRGGHKLGTKIPDKLLAKMRANRQGKTPTRSKGNWTSRRR